MIIDEDAAIVETFTVKLHYTVKLMNTSLT